MKLVTVWTEEGSNAGRLEGDEVVRLPFADVGTLLGSGDDWLAAASVEGERTPLVEASLAPTVMNPSKVFCLGLNYLDHAKEASEEPLPKYPTLFAKFADSLTGPNDDIGLPVVASRRVDWEAEMVIVIGKTIRSASGADAVCAIAGYAVGNDVSMRDWQGRTSEWLQGKVWQSSTPLGAMVTRDEIGGDGRPDLAISCELDGQLG